MHEPYGYCLVPKAIAVLSEISAGILRKGAESLVEQVVMLANAKARLP